MIGDILPNILYFLNLTFRTDLLWVVLPLGIATVVMLFYFEKYLDEKPGWNTHVSNSLVLLFVGVILFRHIYTLDSSGAYNFINFPEKSFVSLGIFILGAIILFLNFEHFLPEKIAQKVTSPLTLNLIAYIAVLFVFTSRELTSAVYLALFILFLFLLIILYLLRIPVKRLFKHLQEMKDKELEEQIIKERTKIDTEKRKIREEEKKVDRIVKSLDKKKKNAMRLKRLARRRK